MNDKTIIFHVEGGIGKNIMATAVAAAIKKKHPDRDIITIGSWPAIWFNNPNVERFYQLGNTPYIFEDYIRDKDTLIMKQEPYHHHGYINCRHRYHIHPHACIPSGIINSVLKEKSPWNDFGSKADVDAVRLSSCPLSL